MAPEDRIPTPAPTPASARRPSKSTAAPAAVRSPVRKPKYVRLKNRLSQPLTPSVLSTNGRDVESLRIGARATSGPIAEDRLTDYTKSLIQRGHLAIA